MQLITLQNFNIQTCFSKFLWFFHWFKDQIISRIHLILPNAHKLMCFDRNINGNRDVKFLKCDYLLVQRCVNLTLRTFTYIPKTSLHWRCQFESNKCLEYLVSIALRASWPFAILGSRILRNPHSGSYLDTPLLFVFDKLKVFPGKEVDIFYEL